jgi:hypothetical protein
MRHTRSGSGATHPPVGQSSGRKAEKVPPPSSAMKRSDSRKSFREDETSAEDDDSDTSLFYLTQGRQKRMRTIDLNKDVLVLRPNEDYEEILGLSEREAEVSPSVVRLLVIHFVLLLLIFLGIYRLPRIKRRRCILHARS